MYCSHEAHFLRETSITTVTRMTDAIVYRGPDDSGHWADAKAGVALGQRRLSIVDLSEAGHQPMYSADGRYILIYNGEIYNHQALRSELEREGYGADWRGHSDTETLLRAIQCWGVEPTLNRAVGMFAIALWDSFEKKLTLVRDRFGEKPLYYGWVGQGEQRAFVFGSELKALRAYPGFSNPISRRSLSKYLHFSYVPAPATIYEDIYKLEAGCLITVGEKPPLQAPDERMAAGVDTKSLVVKRWWSLKNVVLEARQNQIADEKAGLDALDNVLQEAVQLQSMADVPVGVFLSGGIDSSLVSALLQQQSAQRISTFTVGFTEPQFDESPYARAIAKHLGTEHHELVVTPTDIRSLIPMMPTVYDEPFADSSQLPTYLVCQNASRKVKVALSGDAGDELFGGYNRYLWTEKIWNAVKWMPFSARQLLSQGLSAPAVSTWNKLLGERIASRPGEKIHKVARALNNAHSVDEIYQNVIATWPEDQQVVLNDNYTHSRPLLAELDSSFSLVDRMMYCDALTYLQDDILCKVDRAAMANSLETRVPFLDHRVVEMAWRLPGALKVRDGSGKWALRVLLYRRVPKALFDRPKAGFSVPIGEWLRGPLREWGESLLETSRLAREGYFNPLLVRAAWDEHQTRSCDQAAQLWTVLMFQAWLEENSSLENKLR